MTNTGKQREDGGDESNGSTVRMDAFPGCDGARSDRTMRIRLRCERTRCNSDEIQDCERRQHFVAAREREARDLATQMSAHQ